MMLPYPQDRVNGHVLLSDGGGNLYVTEFKKDGGSNVALSYCRACLEFGKRIHKIKNVS